MKSLNWRITTVLASILFACYLLIPTALKFGAGKTVPRVTKADDPWFYRLIPSETLKLGLDLQGGLHLVLGIDFDEVNRNAVEKVAVQLRELAEQNKLTGITASALPNNTVEVKYDNEQSWRALEKLVGQELTQVVDFVSESSTVAFLKLSDEYKTLVRGQAVDQALETLRNRIDEFGIAEPTLQRQGEDKILVQFPGVSDTGRLKDIISRTAKLSFQIVEASREWQNPSVPYSQLTGWVAEYEKAKGLKPDPLKPISEYTRGLNLYLEKKLPKGTEIVFHKETDVNTKETTYEPWLLQREALVTGEDLQDAYYSYDQKTNDPIVNFQLTPTGAIKFEKATGENVNRLMAIVLDNNLHSAPNIEDKIGGGRAVIKMGTRGRAIADVQNDAKDTSLVLRSGALPARLIFLEERVIGPSLGADAIRAGVRSFGGGLLAVFILLFIYYRLSGAVATMALSLNALFVVALMASFEGTLTLPGLAGLALSLGMSVDANVLIFEHMREELKNGKSVNSAIGEGFARSWSAIFDGNLTAIIAALTLLSFGYGPIRGFAVTTLMGLICSMYTAVFVVRVVFDYFVVSRNRKTLSI